MTGAPHVHRRPPPVPTERDLSLWRDLISKADRCVQKPERDAQALFKAAMRAERAVMPVGYQDRASPFVDLIKASCAWRDRKAQARAEVAGFLAEKVAVCRAVLAGDGDGPERPQRKDIFG